MSLIFLKTVWGMWEFKDMTFGDTAAYFKIADLFAHSFMTDITWTPVYTCFFGTVLAILKDPYAAVIWHRIIILAVITLLIFFIGRRLISTNIAFLLAAWWIVLPINHNAYYEVHLFAALAFLLALYLTLRFAGTWGRAITMGALVLIVCLVRNEHLLSAGMFGLACLIVDFVIPFRRHFSTLGWKVLQPVWKYLACVSVSLVLVAGCYLISDHQGEALQRQLKSKHTLNVCQILCYNYVQRTGDTSYNPWTGCHDYMIKHFGKTQISLKEAFLANPKEVLHHFYWNFKLIPSGFQLALFNQRFGKADPDYIDSPRNRKVALALSSLMAGVWVLGIYAAVSHQDREKFRFLVERAWTWLLMGAFVLTAGVVVIMQRPRPSYMFVCTVIIMMITGVAFLFILRRFKLETIFQYITPVLATILVLITPTYWLNQGKFSDLRPIRAQSRLLTWSGVQISEDVKFGAFQFPTETAFYGHTPIDGIDLNAILANSSDLAGFTSELAKHKVRYVMIPGTNRQAAAQKWALTEAHPPGWRLLGQFDDKSEKYYFYDTKSTGSP